MNFNGHACKNRNSWELIYFVICMVVQEQSVGIISLLHDDIYIKFC